MNRQTNARRGVVLLLVLGMLAMFALIGVTFVLLSGHARRSAEAQAKVGRADNPPERIVDDVIRQVLRGSNKVESVIGPHSLLEDLYGDAGALRLTNGVDDDGDNDGLDNDNDGLIDAADFDEGIDEADEADLTFGIFSFLPPSSIVAGGQLLEIPIAIADPSDSTQGVPIDSIPNGKPTSAYVGCVLTMLNGPAAGLSTRIVGYRYDSSASASYAQLLAFDGIQTVDLRDQINTYVTNTGPISFIINGVPFSGTGFGYNPNAAVPGPLLTSTHDGTAAGNPLALLPNPRAFIPVDPSATQPVYPDPAGPGGANEDYDAADYQNMLLACVVPDPSSKTVKVPIPSLHRPSLVNYWFRQLVSSITWPTKPSVLTDDEFHLGIFMYPYGEDGQKDDTTSSTDDPETIHGGPSPADIKRIIDLKRRIILRPLHEDHPDFTGSNPHYYPLWDGQPVTVRYDINFDGSIDPLAETFQPQWDVDNDGDGATDSVWVDVGLPVRSTRDGRLYKPLAAVLCVDLDGRLNFNAHGCLAQAEVKVMGTSGGIDPNNPNEGPYGLPALESDNIIPGGDNIEGDNVDGTKLDEDGTAGPYAANVVRGPGVGPAEINLRALFATAYNANAFYQALLCGNSTIASEGRYGEGWSGTSSPGRSGTIDALSRNRKLHRPEDFNDLSSYAAPVDFKGTQTVCLDLRGQPLYGDLTDPNTLTFDDPYELDMSQKMPRSLPSMSANDNPFSAAELEALLRPYDVDTPLLPKRLQSLLSGLPSFILQGLRHKVTTESWDLPCPAVTMVDDPSTGDPVNITHIAEILTKGKSVSADQIYNLLSPDLLAGLRMDINRAFGDGKDNDGNNVVDEPGEYADEIVQQCDAAGFRISGISNSPIPLDADNDGTPDDTDSDVQARQLFARHLYVLAMAVVDVEGLKDSYTPSKTDEEAARMIAQWAVNVVDFRDRDSIMTGFEYDPKPFTDDSTFPDGITWDVNDNLKNDDPDVTTPHVVWGCERPELLITETLAFHDRRSEDTSFDKTVSDGDPDFDQRYRPRGSLFVELYNPWTNSERAPDELYDNAVIPGVELHRTTLSGGHPVWRLAIVQRSDVNLDPDDPDPTKRPEIERSVYFSGDPAVITGFNPTDDGTSYYPGSSMPAIGPIQPGKYAVVGPPGTTYIGRRKDNDLNQTRHIELDGSDPDDPLAVKYNRYDTGENPATGDSDLPTTDYIQTPVVVEIDSPRRLSVSEPVGGYPAVDDPVTEMYVNIKSHPLDSPESREEDHDVLMLTGTSEEPFRVVHLQRLADPLKDYDPDTNPYLTVDSMPISITAFNGQYPTDDPGANAGKVQFHSRQRGDSGTAAADMNVWNVPEYEKTVTEDNANKVDSFHIFDYFLKHSLGYLNTPFHIDPNDFTEAPGWCSADAGVPGEYYGSPKAQPFPWLTWLNRPFVSSKELMLVPGRRSSQLLKNFTLQNTSARPYVDAIALEATDPRSCFAHLPNFFQSTDGNTNAAGFHRLLEYVRVPSPFVGTQIQTNPQAFAAGTNHSFHPPSNYISKYREPGRVNINTITSSEVWQGIINDVNSTRNDTASWNDIVNSRRGYASATPNSLFELDNDYPTRFADPFRSSAGFYLVPTDELQDDIIKTEANATMLRAEGIPENFDPTTADEPLFHLLGTNSYNNPTRNAYFRYQPLHRLDNLITTRSNVYAVWVTVGYFEVEPVKPWEPSASGPPPVDLRGLTEDEFQRIYPDGYQLGQELGIDTGDVTRHRAFYIIDRSIPVGFERGKDHNVEDTILLRRIIE